MLPVVQDLAENVPDAEEAVMPDPRVMEDTVRCAGCASGARLISSPADPLKLKLINAAGDCVVETVSDKIAKQKKLRIFFIVFAPELLGYPAPSHD